MASIVFKTIRYKNFMSAGNQFTEIDLNADKTTLMVGKNGSGKSTLVDALSFALYGKAYRNINKPMLMNSVNKSACLVELDFSVNGVEFNIKRGMRPGIFEIYQNGILINQDSTNKDYQKHLESNILKMTHKSFCQIVVLGSAAYVPFMQLATWSRREIVEDLLDIQIFSKMNLVLKEWVSQLKESIRDAESYSDVIKEKIRIHRKYIGDLESLNDDQRKKIAEKITSNVNLIEALNNEVLQHENTVDEIGDDINVIIDAANNRRDALRDSMASVKHQMQHVTDTVNFYKTNDSCPMCQQHIEAAHRDKQLENIESNAKVLYKKYKSNSEAYTAIDAEISALNIKQRELLDVRTKIKYKKSEIKRLLAENDVLNDELRAIDGGTSTDLSNARTELMELENDEKKNEELRGNLSGQRAYNDAIGELLKDSGIKTKIVKQYLPVMNKLINYYLQVLDFFVLFNLDENFDETIMSRHRDNFCYASFSEGEKARINLAILFTWRKIAEMKNTASVNLLILDEVLDSAVDADGIDALIRILETLGDDNNVFIISHRGDEVENRFQNKIFFTKEGNFSQMKKSC